MSHNDNYQNKLLSGWEDVFKKGLLTLWILLALKDGPKHMNEISAFINEATGGSLKADDQSMYRALRRYFDAEMVDFTTEPGDGGPERKVYSLNRIGKEVLEAFIERNITSVFYRPAIRQLIERGYES
jgi:PadR family transcriptional regulator PadR